MGALDFVSRYRALPVHCIYHTESQFTLYSIKSELFNCFFRNHCFHLHTISSSIYPRHFPEKHWIVFCFMELVRISVIYKIPLVELLLGVQHLCTITRVETLNCQLDGNSVTVHEGCNVSQGGVLRFLDVRLLDYGRRSSIRYGCTQELLHSAQRIHVVGGGGRARIHRHIYLSLSLHNLRQQSKRNDCVHT
jgi:hypothetical protein